MRVRRALSHACIAAVLGAVLATVGLFAPSPAGAAPSVNIVAVTEEGKLIQFNSNSLGSFSEITVTGVAPGYTLVANDLQPGSDQLFAIARNNAGAAQLYSIAVSGSAGIATLRGDLSVSLNADGGDPPGVGMTFVGTDSIRVTTTAGSGGQNFSISPETGATVQGNAPFGTWSSCALVCSGAPRPAGIANEGSTTIVYDSNNDVLARLTNFSSGQMVEPLTPNITSGRHVAIDIDNGTLWITDEGQSSTNTSKLRATPLNNIGSGADFDPPIGTVDERITSMAIGTPAGNPGGTLDPSVGDFGSVNPGSSSAPKTFTFTNSGDVALVNVSATVTGTNAADFVRQGGTCSASSLSPGQSCTVIYTFTPGSAGARTATLSVGGNAGILAGPAISQTAALTGFGGSPVVRVFGADRIGTSIEISKASYLTPSAGGVVLAKSTDYPDALAGTPLAVKQNAPLLLTPPNALDTNVRSEIQRVLPAGRTVTILGGPQAISPAVETAITSLGYTVKRVQGVDRYDTAVKIAQELGDPTTLFLATGINFPDALAGGAAAARAGAAVLLTEGDRMPSTTASYLGSKPSATRFALGGPAARAVPTATGIVGQDRYDTAARVATQFFTGPTVVGVASGENFPDALSGGAHIGKLGGPLVLVQKSAVPSFTQSYLTANKASIGGAFVYGGPVAIEETVRTAVDTAIA